MLWMVSLEIRKYVKQQLWHEVFFIFKLSVPGNQEIYSKPLLNQSGVLFSFFKQGCQLLSLTNILSIQAVFDKATILMGHFNLSLSKTDIQSRNYMDI